MIECVAPLRVFIVDDSAFARAVLMRIIDEHPSLVVTGSASSAGEAISRLSSTAADVVLLDIAMPGRDGLDALPDLIAVGRGARVLIVSAAAGDGAVATIRALAVGAADTLAKPEAGQLGAGFAERLTERILRLGRAEQPPRLDPFVQRALATTPVSVVGIGASTGGIGALAAFFAALPHDFDAPIFLTQHLPAGFMSYLRDQLATMSNRRVRVGVEGLSVERGDVIVAPGDAHLVPTFSTNGPRAELCRERAETGNLPAVDTMFRALARGGHGAVGVVLSGMGRDGLHGAHALVEADCDVVVQDECSSTIWGMPGSVARAGLASLVAPASLLALHLAGRGAR